MNQRIVAHTAGDKRSVLLIDTFHQNFLYGMKMSCGYLAGNFLDLGKKTVKTVFYNIRGIWSSMAAAGVPVLLEYWKVNALS